MIRSITLFRIVVIAVTALAVVVPLSIVIAVAIQDAWRAVASAGQRMRAAVRGALVAAAVVGVCDALSNAVAVRMVMTGISAASITQLTIFSVA